MFLAQIIAGSPGRIIPLMLAFRNLVMYAYPFAKTIRGVLITCKG